MAPSTLSVFDRTVQESIKMIDDVSAEAQLIDRHDAFQALRATLQTLRDRLPVGEAPNWACKYPFNLPFLL